ncbi:RNA polymerase sigma factor [Sphingobium sp. TB-6]|uniref:RNA polymerase sigma factor n=1 Tax=Sphingobium sp. TB-6 TaxID=2728850 RepID=UPI00146E9BA9|nr:RNA polymerase sigma factor [Sphingobium sp. TB-6]NML91830.1 RNA polymerase sigma factor [Sphingobium sp. TB-6]
MSDPITPAIWRKLVSLMRRRAGMGSDAEDLVQEAYARFIEQSSKTAVHNPQGFIFRVATNLAITAARSQTRHSVIEADPAVLALISPGIPAQHEVLEARERLRLVELAIDQLPTRARQVFVLHRVEGLTYGEISRELDISVSAVEKNMARALMHLTISNAFDEKVQESGKTRNGRKSKQC